MPIWHSPLLRSVQTAQVVRDLMGWKQSPLLSKPNLLPEDAPSVLMPTLNGLRREVMIVGHEPHLSALTTLLLTGQRKPVAIKFRKAALLCLERRQRKGLSGQAPQWRLRWHLSPELFP